MASRVSSPKLVRAHHYSLYVDQIFQSATSGEPCLAILPVCWLSAQRAFQALVPSPRCQCRTITLIRFVSDILPTQSNTTTISSSSFKLTTILMVDCTTRLLVLRVALSPVMRGMAILPWHLGHRDLTLAGTICSMRVRITTSTSLPRNLLSATRPIDTPYIQHSDTGSFRTIIFHQRGYSQQHLWRHQHHWFRWPHRHLLTPY